MGCADAGGEDFFFMAVLLVLFIAAGSRSYEKPTLIGIRILFI
jgi:hypothetical protein